MFSAHILPDDAEDLVKLIRFHLICKLAKNRDEKTLKKFITQGEDLNVWTTFNGRHTPISYLAAINDNESVNFLINFTREAKAKKDLIDQAVRGYAFADNSNKVDEFLMTWKADIERATIGYISGDYTPKALDLVKNKGANADETFFYCATYEREAGIQQLINTVTEKSIFRVLDHYLNDNLLTNESQHLLLLRLLSFINNENVRKKALGYAINYSRRTIDIDDKLLEKAAEINKHIIENECDFKDAMRQLFNVEINDLKQKLPKKSYDFFDLSDNEEQSPPLNNASSIKANNISLIGDSTIDNEVWVDGIFWNYLSDHIGITRDDSGTRIKKHNENSCIKPELSIVEHLTNILPNDYQINDLTNDGFTTTDCLNGAMRCKVFGKDTFKLFPYEKFSPLKDGNKNIQESSHIILSVGGNNFREFLIETLKHIQDKEWFIKKNYPIVMNKLKTEYIKILTKLREINPNANIILLTQYYPSVSQNTYKIYPFMQELGNLLGFGPDPLDTIHRIMKDTYQVVLKEALNGCDLSLINADDLNIIEFDQALKEAKEERTPILIKIGNEYCVYGDPKNNGEWKCTKIKSERINFNALPFAEGRINRNYELFNDLIDELKVGHALLSRPGDNNIVVADITSSLDPYENTSFVSQIEPSGPGGKKIASMLSHVIKDNNQHGVAYRFLPGFFLDNNTDPLSTRAGVEITPIAEWKPVHPRKVNLPKDKNKNSFGLNNTLSKISIEQAKINLSKLQTTIFSNPIKLNFFDEKYRVGLENTSIHVPVYLKNMLDEIQHVVNGMKHIANESKIQILLKKTLANIMKIASTAYQHDANQIIYKNIFNLLDINVSKSLTNLKKHIESQSKEDWQTLVDDRPTTVNTIYNIVLNNQMNDNEKLFNIIQTAWKAEQGYNPLLDFYKSIPARHFYVNITDYLIINQENYTFRRRFGPSS